MLIRDFWTLGSHGDQKSRAKLLQQRAPEWGYRSNSFDSRFCVTDWFRQQTGNVNFTVLWEVPTCPNGGLELYDHELCLGQETVSGQYFNTDKGVHYSKYYESWLERNVSWLLFKDIEYSLYRGLQCFYRYKRETECSLLHTLQHITHCFRL